MKNKNQFPEFLEILNMRGTLWLKTTPFCNILILNFPVREGLPYHSFPKSRHFLDGGGLTLALIFLKDLSTCTEGPQR